MRNKTYKIVVLSDLKDSMAPTLKSAVSLAKIVNGEIAFFHVKNPSDVIKKENQLSAIRTINHEHTTTDKKIQNSIKSFSEDYGVNINYSFTFGNVKNEIGAYIKEHRPDIIVLGKKKSKPLNLIGDNITHFVLKQHKGTIMIVDDKNALEPNKELSLGVLNGMEQVFNTEFTDDLMGHSRKPLKSFKIVKNSNTLKAAHTPSDKNVIEYVFEQGDNSIKNLSNYVSKNHINLLCMDRPKDKINRIEENPTITSDIKNIIGNLNVSLLIMGNQKYTVQ